MSPHSVVIGGGLAGLTAALDLADSGRQVTLLESRPRLGGATSSFRRGDLEVDNGQHVFLGCCSAYRGLLARLGVTGQTVLQDRLDVPVLVARPRGVRRARLTRARALPPLHLAPALLRYGALPLRSRVRAVPAALALGRLDVRDPAVDRQSFGAWLSAHGQTPAAVEALWGLLTVATLNAEPGDASLALAATVVQTGLLGTADGADIGWSAVPLGELHGAAAARALTARGVRIRTGERVDGVVRATGGWTVRCAPIRGERHDVTAGDIVLAVPADSAVRLIPAGSGVNLDALRSLGTAPIVNIHLVYDRRVLEEPFVAVLGSPIQWIFDRSSQSGRPAGTYLALSQSAAGPWIDKPAAELIASFRAEVERLLPVSATAQVLDAFVTRERGATFAPAPGQAALRPASATDLPGFALAGAWTDTGWPATMEGAVRSGHAAASHLLRTSRDRLGVAA